MWVGLAEPPMTRRGSVLAMPQSQIARLLIDKGHELLEGPRQIYPFTGNPAADRLINDLDAYPHAYVLACVMDRQIRAEKAWEIPYRFAEKLGGFEFERLRGLDLAKVRRLMTHPRPLHRFIEEMSKNFVAAVELIGDRYEGDAARIWNDTPSSAELVWRFLAFRGVGPKIATMAANILVRHLKVPLRDYYSIDVSVDVQVRRVMSRLGLIDEGSSVEQVVYRARALNPSFPGLLDYPAWEIGRRWCRPTQPACGQCYMHEVCPSRTA